MTSKQVKAYYSGSMEACGFYGRPYPPHPHPSLLSFSKVAQLFFWKRSKMDRNNLIYAKNADMLLFRMIRSLEIN